MNNSEFKIIFMGTPEFAVPSLKILIENNYNIPAVVTVPDKQKGRGQKFSFSPVKEFALENNIKIFQPEKLKDELFINSLKELNADLFVVVAFRILPKEVFTIPKRYSFNLHASLLPKYRGAAPIQWALIKGEKETGVTSFALAEKVDTGNILLQEKINIEDDENFQTLHDKLSLLGAKTVLETVNLIQNGNEILKPQNDIEATPAPKIFKENCLINWNKSNIEIHNLVRGLSPYPAAYFINDEKSIKVFKTKIVDNINLSAGEIIQTKTNIFIGCGKGSIEILELQPEGRKRLTAEVFLRGYKLKEIINI